MGTPASDQEAVTQLSLDFEGLRISITSSRLAAPASLLLPDRNGPPTFVVLGNCQTNRCGPGGGHVV